MFAFCAAAFLTLGAFAAAGAFVGGASVKSGGDYSLGGRSSSAGGVAGTLLGALAGGASTVGTVQMAYTYGIAAWWFTLGCAAGCLLLGLKFAAPIRESNITTVADFLAQSYGGEKSFTGGAIACVVTASSSAGTFISICVQFLACAAMLRGAFSLSALSAAAVTAVSVLGFILTGGLKSYSRLGKAKIALLYAALAVCAFGAVKSGGSFSMVTARLSSGPWFNPFSQGLPSALGYPASIVIGVFTTQIYIQSIASAKDARTARAGAFVSAALMAPMGLFGVWVGLTARASGIEMAAENVLPWFIMNTFPPVVAGVLWGSVLITVMGCAAGLILGIATNIVKNLVPEKLKSGREANIQRAVVAGAVLIGSAAAAGSKGFMLLEWSGLAMGLRGAGAFLPFVLAVLRPGLISPRWALASSVCGLAGTLASPLLGWSGNPLFPGAGLSFICVLIGLAAHRRG